MKTHRAVSRSAAILLTAALFHLPVSAATYIVAQAAPNASDTNPGSAAKPLKSIQAGADRAEPGDTILVHAGTYRERVAPPRGGTTEQKRIVYKAATGENVFIKGSDRITNWRKQESGLWMASVDNERFQGYNPYELTIHGEWLDYGEGYHRGDVYFEGTAYTESKVLDTVQKRLNTWYCRIDSNKTKIWANFGVANPNTGLAEINVRHTVFFPEKIGLKYITVDGFTIMHSAENWGPPGTRNGDGQWGAIGPRWGYAWIIENCTVINAKCIGITLGVVPGVSMDDIGTWGHHIIRNNHIMRCAQSGIAGDAGNVVSLIDHNLVEETNDRMVFGGTEGAGIKFHFATDVTISNNVIRGVHDREGHGGYGIWLDFGCQNTRVTGNVIYGTKKQCLFMEATHGPILLDNNLFIGNDIMAHSESQVFVHNLFYHSSITWARDDRRTPIYAPHSFKHLKSQQPIPRDNKWYNNIFIGGGIGDAPDAPGFEIDDNVFLAGAKKSRYDSHSIVDTAQCNENIFADSNLIAVDFGVSAATLAAKYPMVGSRMLGTFPITGMMVEDKFGNPIELNTDFYGKPRTPAVFPGPFQSLAAGMNSFTLWSKVQGPARPYRITVLPAEDVVKPGATQQYSTFAWDQFGKPVDASRSLTWKAAGGGAINGKGVFAAGNTEGGPFVITAKIASTAGQAAGTANIWISKETPGLAYSYYEGAWKFVPDFGSLTPLKTGTVPTFDVGVPSKSDSFGIRFEGRINVPAAGTYTFYVNADDGCRFFIDGALVADDDGGHAIKEVQGEAELAAGFHTIAANYIQGIVQRYLTVEWKGPGFERQKIPTGVLFLPKGK